MHNILMTALQEDAHLVHVAFEGIRAQAITEGYRPSEHPFQAARRILRRHYQWMVLNDFLPAFADADVRKPVRNAGRDSIAQAGDLITG